VSPATSASDAVIWPALDSPDGSARARPRNPERRRYAWAALLQRVFAIDAIRCAPTADTTERSSPSSPTPPPCAPSCGASGSTSARLPPDRPRATPPRSASSDSPAPGIPFPIPIRISQAKAPEPRGWPGNDRSPMPDPNRQLPMTPAPGSLCRRPQSRPPIPPYSMRPPSHFLARPNPTAHAASPEPLDRPRCFRYHRQHAPTKGS